MGRSLRGVSAAVAAVAMAATMLSACNPDGPDGPDADAQAAFAGGLVPAAPPSTVTSVEPNGVVVDVAALDNYYQPESVEITAGTEVRWEARGRNEHDVLPADADQEWGAENEVFHPGATYSYVFDTPGTFAYYCSIHGTATAGMLGTVVVLPPDA
jgi:plastocyanin